MDGCSKLGHHLTRENLVGLGASSCLIASLFITKFKYLLSIKKKKSRRREEWRGRAEKRGEEKEAKIKEYIDELSRRREVCKRSQFLAFQARKNSQHFCLK